MTDDAAQDKKTEDDSIAEADAQGSAETVAEPKVTVSKDEPKPAESKDEPKAAEPEATPEPAKAESAEPAADSAKESEKKESEKPEPAAESAPAEKSALLSAVGVPLIALVALGVLLVAAIAAAAGFAWQSHTRANQLDEREAPTQAACDFMRTFTAYDDKSMPNFAEQVKARITDGQFKKSFEPAATELQELLIKQHAKATLNFLHCGYETGDAEKATVLVNALQTASNDLHTQPMVLPIPAFVDLEKKDGKWLVSDFRAIYSNDAGGAIPGATPGGDNQQGVQPSGQATPAPTSAAPKPGS
ncbi:hypothetical protein JMUB6875_36020 [Nocardia sp. JMUB6875]|uniref:hypothetical protein n=1 Tax=Nocardia sp. JMUB6875 TaxID=3158170 RepID=UPI0032E7A744